ncbi:MAG: hypothetical protein H7840_10525 [Alphaproteobacteria bacterium]
MLSDGKGAAMRVDTRWRHVLVVFCDTTELWWLRLMRRGFRHCFVALGDGRGWITIDPLSHRTDIAVHPPGHAADLAAAWRARGLTVVETYLREPPPRPAPWRPYTCVEAVKRVLGIHDGTILTPWQLHRFLTGISTKSQRPGPMGSAIPNLGRARLAG